jgi:hypothetical protein
VGGVDQVDDAARDRHLPENASPLAERCRRAVPVDAMTLPGDVFRLRFRDARRVDVGDVVGEQVGKGVRVAGGKSAIKRFLSLGDRYQVTAVVRHQGRSTFFLATCCSISRTLPPPLMTAPMSFSISAMSASWYSTSSARSAAMTITPSSSATTMSPGRT